MVAQWKQNLNVEVSLEMADFSENIRQEKNCHVLMRGWIADYPDPENFFKIRVIDWQTDSYIKLLDRARRTYDQHERIHLYQAADKLLIEEAVLVPIYYGRFHILVKPWVKNIHLERINFSMHQVIIEPH
jgi:oligopeptide transport system substrate-binding protein